MTTARRLTALASALFALSSGVSAATLPDIDVNFEAAGAAASDPAVMKPVEVASEPGLKLSGAWGYGWSMLDDVKDSQAKPGEFDGGSCAIAPLGGTCNTGGFIVNRNRGQGNGSKIVLELDSALFPNRYFQSITFDLFTYSSVNPKVYVYDTAGKSAFSDNFKADDGNRFWTKGTGFDVASLLANVTKLEFDVGASTLGLDNLKIVLTAATVPPPGGTVPEPASYALVGLALLAAGVSRRRSA
jgi:PEP-CTERM motif